jgi:hypothetical protein
MSKGGVAQPKAGKPHPSSLRRTGLCVSFLGVSGALYLTVFEQPANRVFFSILLGRKSRRGPSINNT